jgi:hypothetical protein
MKKSIEKRIKKLEQATRIKERHKWASVVCDPDILHTQDFSFIQADAVLILPDNGNRLPHGQRVPKGSYIIRYS